jgi:uncharacterized membrane-anchored protein YitT (DUF2179 family)
MSKYPLHHKLTDGLYVVAGALLMAFALKSFLVPNGFLDGGVTGLSLLLHEAFHTSPLVLALILTGANLPFILMGYFSVSGTFVVKTVAGVIVLALCFTLIPFPQFLDPQHLAEAGRQASEGSHAGLAHHLPQHFDRILLSIFGGFFLGLGIGLGMRGGCALDGIEVLALYTLRRSSFTISEIILGINAILFLLATFIVGFDVALYAILTYYVATRTIDYVIEGLEEFTGVTIISAQSEEIKRRLVRDLGRGITIYKGERGFLKDSFEVSTDVDIVFTVITRLEVRRLRNLVHSIDPKAFVFTHTIKEAAGGVLSRTAHH